MKQKILSGFLVAAALPLLPSAASAQPPAAVDDILNRIISVPNPQSYRVDGVRNAAVRRDEAVQGGRGCACRCRGEASRRGR